MAGYGRRVLDEMVLLEMVRQYAAEQGAPVTAEDITSEFDSLVENLAPGKTRREQLALFNYMLQSRNLTRPEFDLIIERQALLRGLVDPNVIVTEQMLADEYERQHGRKVLVRQLVLSSFRSIQEAQKRLEDGEEFTQIIEQFSQDQPTLTRGGLLGPFSRTDEHIPEIVREFAFELSRPGQRSKTFRYFDEENLEWWCLLQLEKDYPPDHVPLAEVRGELEQIIRRQELTRRMLNLPQKLKSRAGINILEPELKP